MAVDEFGPLPMEQLEREPFLAAVVLNDVSKGRRVRRAGSDGLGVPRDVGAVHVSVVPVAQALLHGLDRLDNALLDPVDARAQQLGCIAQALAVEPELVKRRLSPGGHPLLAPKHPVQPAVHKFGRRLAHASTRPLSGDGMAYGVEIGQESVGLALELGESVASERSVHLSFAVVAVG